MNTMNSAIIIRPINSNDKDAWLSLRLALWPEHTKEELLKDMEQIIANPLNQMVFGAVNDNAVLIGFIEVSIRPIADGCSTAPVGYIEGWFVQSDYQQQGVGKQLVEAAEQWARTRGLKEMASDCLLDNTVSANAHVALGYTIANKLIHFRKSLYL